MPAPRRQEFLALERPVRAGRDLNGNGRLFVDSRQHMDVVHRRAGQPVLDRKLLTDAIRLVLDKGRHLVRGARTRPGRELHARVNEGGIVSSEEHYPNHANRHQADRRHKDCQEYTQRLVAKPYGQLYGSPVHTVDERIESAVDPTSEPVPGMFEPV